MARRLAAIAFISFLGVSFGVSNFSAAESKSPNAIPSANTATPAADAVISYPVDKNSSGIGLLEILPVMGEILSLYKEDVKKHGVDFNWNFDWDKPWLGAGSEVFDGSFSIMLWGGFIRADRATLPMLEFTICHEFGHLLGGPPQQIIPGEGAHWSSAEGQADWWAASVCLPRIYGARGIAPVEIEKRIQTAGLEFARFVEFHYDHNPVAVSLKLSASETPQQTLTLAYPSLQCRLDTIRIGAACAAASNSSTCERPRCWFVAP